MCYETICGRSRVASALPSPGWMPRAPLPVREARRLPKSQASTLLRFIPSVLPSSGRLGQRPSWHPGWVDPVLPSGYHAGGLAPARQNSHERPPRRTPLKGAGRRGDGARNARSEAPPWWSPSPTPGPSPALPLPCVGHVRSPPSSDASLRVVETVLVSPPRCWNCFWRCSSAPITGKSSA